MIAHAIAFEIPHGASYVALQTMLMQVYENSSYLFAI